MTITATSMAQSYYENYEFADSQAGKDQSSGEAAAAETDYGISDLSSALGSLGIPANIYSITNLDTYVKNAFMLSQTSENSVLSSMADADFSDVNNLEQSIADNYSKNKLGLPVSSGVNLNGLLTAENSAQTSLELSKLGASTDQTSNYLNYLNGNSETGILLGSKG